MDVLTLTEVDLLKVRVRPSGILESLSPETWSQLEAQGTYVRYNEEWVVRDGQKQEYFFFVASGYFSVSKQDPDTQRTNILGTIKVGQCFGEMSLCTDAPASADIYAYERVIAWAIPHATFKKFILTHPEGARIALQISALVAGRLDQGNIRLMGISTALNSYFGHVVRTADLKVTSLPQSGDYAEMEIPEEVFNGLSIMALGLNDVGLLTPARRDAVRQKIENHEIEVIPWLETTDRGLKLKIRLKYGSSKNPS